MPLLPVVALIGITAFASFRYDPPLKRSMKYLLPALALIPLYYGYSSINDALARNRRDTAYRIERDQALAEAEKKEEERIKREKEELFANTPRDLPSEQLQRILVKHVYVFGIYSHEVSTSYYNGSDWSISEIRFKVSDEDSSWTVSETFSERNILRPRKHGASNIIVQNPRTGNHVSFAKSGTKVVIVGAKGLP